MYDLESIVAQNRRAAKLGITKPGTAVGTKGVKPVPVVVKRLGTNEIIDRLPSANEACLKYRQEQKAGEVEIVDAEDAATE